MAGPGTTTFLLTDVEGSTRLWEDETEAMQAALAWHDATVAEIVARHGGALVKTRGEGDSTFSVFSRPSAAVAAALDIQRRLQRSEEAVGLAIRVRMGIHTGEAEMRDGDFYGPTVNRCARLRATANGGQVVLSEAAAEIAAGALPPGATLDDLGIHRLKDLARPEHVFQLSHPDLQRAFPPLRSLDSRTHNLPVQLTRFVGRERELGALAEALAKSRLVTVTGIGGVGKTRLALQVAADAVDRHRHGSWFVELDSVAAERVPAAVAGVLRLREESGRPLVATVLDHLVGRDMLLVLDNCEHVVDDVARLTSAVVETAPTVTVLATSREALGIPGEVVIPLAPLPPPAGDDLAALRASDAAALFLDRAQLAKADFALRPGDEAALARICRELDGIALAIELAAARVRIMTVPQIAERLADRFRLLTGGSRTAAQRQQTLRATIGWSYDLLSPEEQRVFRLLSLFPSGTTLADAAAVAGMDVFDAVVQLVDKSVVVASDDDRFSMLNTVRAYALDRLRELDEEVEARHRQLDWANGLLAESDHNRIAVEHANLLDLLRWAEAVAPAAGLGIAFKLKGFWDDRGHWATGRHWLERLAAADRATDPSARAAALAEAAGLAIVQGDLEGARALLARSEAELGDEYGAPVELVSNRAVVAAYDGDLATARRLFEQQLDESATDHGRLNALTSLGNVAFAAGDLHDAASFYDAAIDAARQVDDSRVLASALTNRGVVALAQGEGDRAEHFLHEGAELARKLGNDAQIAAATTHLGGLRLRRGDLGSARVLVEEALETQRRMGEPAAVAYSLVTLAEIARRSGDTERARVLARDAGAAATAAGFRSGVADAELVLGAIASEDGDGAAALAHFQRALEIGDAARMAIEVFDGVAALAVAGGQPGLAARLLGAADACRGRAGAAPSSDPDRTRTEARCREALGPEQYDAAVAEGRQLNADEAVALVRALDLADQRPVR